MPDKPADWNDAYVWPPPDQPHLGEDAVEYEVVGETSVDGHAPGEKFKASLSEDRRRLLLGSHLALVAPDSFRELQAKARELDIPGRSGMDKAELQQAVDAALQAQADPAEFTNPAAGLAQDDQQ